MIDIYIATHKKLHFDLPPIYKWVQVNAAKNGEWEGYLHDSDGEDNISEKNDSYCELTVLYQLWKNSKADIQGLCHYRRFLGKRPTISLLEMGSGYIFKKDSIGKQVLAENDLKGLLDEADVLLARNLGPYPLTAFEDLQRFVYLEDITAMIAVIEKFFPDYQEALWETLAATNLSYCNIFIAKRSFTHAYCPWLFSVLRKVEKMVDISGYDKNHKRIFGYLAEVLLNVYVRRNRIRTQTLDLVMLDEVPGPISFKRKVWLLNERLRVSVGLFPLVYEYEKEKAKYMRLKKGEVSTIALTYKALSSYFLSIGCKNVSIVSDAKKIKRLLAGFSSYTIQVMIVDDKDQLLSVYSLAKDFRNKDLPFTTANVTRAYCAFVPTREEVISAYNNGVVLMPNTNG